MRPAQAWLRITLDHERAAAAVHAALLPEAAEGPDGSSTTLVRTGAALEVELAAQDLSTLRAALNSVLRLLDAARRAIE